MTIFAPVRFKVAWNDSDDDFRPTSLPREQK